MLLFRVKGQNIDAQLVKGYQMGTLTINFMNDKLKQFAQAALAAATSSSPNYFVASKKGCFDDAFSRRKLGAQAGIEFGQRV